MGTCVGDPFLDDEEIELQPMPSSLDVFTEHCLSYGYYYTCSDDPTVCYVYFNPATGEEGDGDAYFVPSAIIIQMQRNGYGPDYGAKSSKDLLYDYQ